MYKEVFPEPEFEYLDNIKSEDESTGMDMRKIYKIKYSVNLLTQIGQHFETQDDEQYIVNEGLGLMNLCAINDELEKFQAESLTQLIQYKWETFGRQHHFIGCIMHFINTLLIIAYIVLSYYQEPEEGNVIQILLAIAVTYPFFYESY